MWQSISERSSLINDIYLVGDTHDQLHIMLNQQYGNAMKCYQSAVDGLKEVDSADWKRALYRAGVLAAALKNYESSEK